jgi:hypothetical protein
MHRRLGRQATLLWHATAGWMAAARRNASFPPRRRSAPVFEFMTGHGEGRQDRAVHVRVREFVQLRLALSPACD